MNCPLRLGCWLAAGISLSMAACGGGGSAAATSAPATSSSASTSTGTASVDCDYAGSGTQALSYKLMRFGAVNDTLPYSFAWTCDTTTRHLASNGVPNHDVSGGTFATRLSAQNTAHSFPLAPSATGMTTVRTPAYALNGVRFEPGTAGTCPDTATSDMNCSYGPGGPGSWRMEALPGSVSPWKFDFGTDANLAHTQPTGEYHYHGVPTGLLAKLNPTNANAMTLVGFATDGFPVYARLGYTVATDKNSALKAMSGSYRVKSTPDANRPSTTYFPMGHFVQDWQYVAGSGDLDECNGRFGVTPEFPNGIYHYYLTDSYPFVQRCVKGSVPAGT